MFVIACDDTYAPKQYFEFLRLPRVKVHVLAAEAGQDHQNAISRLREFKKRYEWLDGDELWVLLDTDHFDQGTHLGAFLGSLRAASDLGAKVAISKPCFELWLALHGGSDIEFEGLSRCGDVVEAWRGYDKTALKAGDYLPPAIARACAAAEARDREVVGGDIPQAATTRVYKLMWSILRTCSPAALPEDLSRWVRALLN
jgi:hypothetical protein